MSDETTFITDSVLFGDEEDTLGTWDRIKVSRNDGLSFEFEIVPTEDGRLEVRRIDE